MKMQKLETMQSQLNMAKNYLEQKVELSVGRRSIVFGSIYGMIVFHDGENVVAAVKDRMLHIFHEQVKFADLQFPTRSSAVDLETIKSAKALFCKRCRRWLAFHPILNRCSCGTYLKERKRFYLEESEIENSDELAETIFAIKDMKDAMKIERSRRTRKIVSKHLPTVSSDLGNVHAECKLAMNRIETTVQSWSYFAEKMVLKISGRIVAEECKIPMLLQMMNSKDI